MLYKLAYNKELKHLKTLIRPDKFEICGLGSVLTAIGGIPATMIKEKNGGAVERIVHELKICKRSRFLISPKGTIVKGAWRSGYFHIAKQLEANLVAIGMDYEKKCVFIGQIVSHKLEEVQIKALLLDDIRKIVPKFADREVVEIRKHDQDDVHLIHPYRLCVVIGAMGLCCMRLLRVWM